MIEICEICGKSGTHPECDFRAQQLMAEFRLNDQVMLARHARFGTYGLCAEDSQASLTAAEHRLVEYLGRTLTYDAKQLIEGNSWWFIPEGWIGMIGFIVEKESGKIFPLGSGLAGNPKSRIYAHWCAIELYEAGKISSVE